MKYKLQNMCRHFHGLLAADYGIYVITNGAHIYHPLYLPPISLLYNLE